MPFDSFVCADAYTVNPPAITAADGDGIETAEHAAAPGTTPAGAYSAAAALSEPGAEELLANAFE